MEHQCVCGLSILNEEPFLSHQRICDKVAEQKQVFQVASSSSRTSPQKRRKAAHKPRGAGPYIGMNGCEVQGTGYRGGPTKTRLKAKPRTLPCYLCGYDFGSASIHIHMAQCYKKQVAIWNISDPAERGHKPMDPQTFFNDPTLYVIATSPPKSRQEDPAETEGMHEAWSKTAHACPHCNHPMPQSLLQDHLMRCCLDGEPEFQRTASAGLQEIGGPALIKGPRGPSDSARSMKSLPDIAEGPLSGRRSTAESPVAPSPMPALPAPLQSCVECGHAMEPRDNFCPECGIRRAA
uniref:Putative zinc-ribbon domain-containing protein n=1 Tax=Eutreptiella gymnastica TaxID=73025 RepID=A0A7S4GAN2_9EUGL